MFFGRCMKMWLTKLLLISIVTSQLLHNVNSKAASLRMSFKENEEKGTLVANLYQLFNIQSSLKHARYFQMLSQRLMVGNQLVTDQGHWIVLNTDNGHLEVSDHLDRERDCGNEPEVDCVIELEVALLPNEHFRIMHFDFWVADDNDHAPKFPEIAFGDKFSVDVPEDSSIGTTVSLDHFMATDDDSGQNAEIYYTLEQNDYFGIEQYDDTIGTSHVDLVVIKEPDFETKRSFELYLTARDYGEPSRKTQRHLLIKIIDKNDHSPIFEKKEYSLDLKENLPAGTLIYTLLARDADYGFLGEITYFIPKKGNSKEARDLLTIQPETGELRLKKELDREKHNGIRVVIGAKDGGTRSDGGAKVGKTILVISVEDVNDNDPVIHVNIVLNGPKKDNAYVPEDAKRGIFIAHITASDADTEANGEVDISMKTYPVDDAFELEDNLVKITSSLDREIHSEYTLELKACDHGKSPRCSKKNVTVIIVDINDHYPQFVADKRNFVIPENREIGTLLTHVQALDKDALNLPALTKTRNNEFVPSSNGAIRFSMIGGKNTFSIEPLTGKITLVGSLDYEETNSYKLIVTARDLGSPRLSNKTTITVTVLDVNDHRPEFSNPALDNSTLVATILDTGAIAVIKASDRDTGKNAVIRYSLVKEDKAKDPAIFILDKVTGELRFNSSNNLREVIGDHKVILRATDSGIPPLSSTTAIYIRVTDLSLSEIRENYGTKIAGLEPSIILLVSLAAATVVLLAILAFIIVKCKRESKEIRTYSCRNAESKKSWISKGSTTPPRHSMIDEVVVVTSPNNVTSMRDENFMRSMEIGRKNTLKSSCSNSHSNALKDLANMEDGRMSAFSSRSYGNYKQDMQVRTQTDGDSGKGESDKDSVSGERDNKSVSPPVSSQYESQSMQYLNNLGPNCTDHCRHLGHSDQCWMNVSATTLNERPSRVSSPRNVDLGYALHPIHETYHQNQNNFDNMENIEETQPLHYVLDSNLQPNDYPSYPQYANNTYEDFYYPEMTAPYNRNSINFSHHNTVPRSMTPPTDYYAPSRASPHHHEHVTSPTTSSTTLKPFHSNPVSPQPLDGSYRPPSQRNSVAEIPLENASVGDKIRMFSKSPAPTGVQRKPSNASLRENLLQRRHLNNTSFSSTHSYPSPPNGYSGETSMQETEEILSNIDQLIIT